MPLSQATLGLAIWFKAERVHRDGVAWYLRQGQSHIGKTSDASAG